MVSLSRGYPPRMGIYTFFISSLATIALAQQSSVSATAGATPTTISTSTKASTSSAPAATHTIQVGNGDHKFKPDVTQAQVGDIIEFHFFPPNHSVVRAEYEYPCIPYEMTGRSKTGFFSGFHPVDAILDNPPKYSFRVNETDPIFFYCSALGSCTDFGMVGVINPNATMLLSHQRSLALDSAYALNPGESFPAESPLPSNLPDPTSTNPSTPAIPSDPHSSRHLSTGAIVGIVIAGISVLALAGLLFFFIGRSKALKEEMRRKSSTIRHTSPPSPFAMLQSHDRNGMPNLPPAYFNSTPKYVYAARDFGSPTGGAGGGVNRSLSHRSMGGTFDISPTTGYYTRTHDGEDTYKLSSPGGPHPSEAERTNTSPRSNASLRNSKFREGSFEVGSGGGGGGGVPLGPYGRQQAQMQGGTGGLGRAVNEGSPAEMDGGFAGYKL